MDVIPERVWAISWGQVSDPSAEDGQVGDRSPR
jgi:hypothetical protein